MPKPISVELRREYPNAPWRWRENWESGRIRTHHTTKLVLSIILALIWNAITWSLYGKEIVCLLQEPTNWSLMVALLIHPLAGIGLLVWALIETWRWLTVGESTLFLESNPGRIGGNFIGRIENHRIQADKIFELKLSCVSRETSRGKYRCTHENVLWRSIQRVQSNRATDRETAATVLSFQFEIPRNRRPCCEEATSTDGVGWVLEVAKVEEASANPQTEAATDSIVASFDVPIF